MQKYGHIGTFPMGETGPHIAILVLSVVPHFNSMVYSKMLASSASVGDCGVVWDDRREPPRISCLKFDIQVIRLIRHDMT